jgi:hypothetical protein
VVYDLRHRHASRSSGSGSRRVMSDIENNRGSARRARQKFRFPRIFSWNNRKEGRNVTETGSGYYYSDYTSTGSSDTDTGSPNKKKSIIKLGVFQCREYADSIPIRQIVDGKQTWKSPA